MPEKALAILNAALDSYDGSDEDKDYARQWLEAVASQFEPADDAEIAAVLEAIAESDLEDAQGVVITLEQVEADLDEMIANYQPKPVRV